VHEKQYISSDEKLAAEIQKIEDGKARKDSINKEEELKEESAFKDY
jgi:hypothetical protein